MEDLKHYLLLAAILSVALGLFWYFNYNRQIQIGVVIAAGVSYLCWGVVHHWLKKDLHWQVILEYLAVALVACIALIFLLIRT